MTTVEQYSTGRTKELRVFDEQCQSEGFIRMISAAAGTRSNGGRVAKLKMLSRVNHAKKITGNIDRWRLTDESRR